MIALAICLTIFSACLVLTVGSIVKVVKQRRADRGVGVTMESSVPVRPASSPTPSPPPAPMRKTYPHPPTRTPSGTNVWKCAEPGCDFVTASGSLLYIGESVVDHMSDHEVQDLMDPPLALVDDLSVDEWGMPV